MKNLPLVGVSKAAWLKARLIVIPDLISCMMSYLSGLFNGMRPRFAPS